MINEKDSSMIDKKKICFFIDNAFIYEIDFSNIENENPGIGGTEFVFLKDAFLLKKNGYDVELILTKKPKNKEFIPIPFVCIDDKVKACEWARDNNFDIIVFRDAPKINYSNFKNIYILCWFHNWPSNKQVKKLLAEHSNVRAIFVSKTLFNLYATTLRTNKKTYYIYNPLTKSNNNLIIRNPSSKFAFIGSIVPGKGLHRLLEQIPSIRKKIPDMELTIIGSSTLYYNDSISEYELECRDLIEKNGMHDYVHFTGKMNSLQIDDVLKDISLGIVVSECETFCISATDFMRNSIPVVAPIHGAIPEITPSTTGINFLRRNSLSRAIYKTISPKRYSKLQKNAFKLSQRFIDERIVEQWDDLLNNLEKKANLFQVIKSFFFKQYYYIRFYFRLFISKF